MLRLKLTAILLALIVLPVQAEVWKDYAPSEHVTELTVVSVKPNYFDNYITNLETTWVKAMQIQKELGYIVDYNVWIASNADSPNVWLTVRYENLAAMQGSEERYKNFMEKLLASGMDEDANDKVSKGYEEYRTIVDRAVLHEVSYR